MSQIRRALRHVMDKSIMNISHPVYVVEGKLHNEATESANMQEPNPIE